MAQSVKKYTAKDITVLEGLEPVRRRPAMYIGSVDAKGLHHLVWEIVDNAVDEYLNGFADAIEVTLHKGSQAVTVSDNGRGIPVDSHPQYKRPALELILTTLHSGAKFGDSDSYFHSGGLHGVGSSVVNALSRKLVATVRRDGYEWVQSFCRGKKTTELKKCGPARGHGTTIYFEPDPDIFGSLRFDAATIRGHLDDMGYIHPGLRLVFCDQNTGQKADLSHPQGIPEFLAHLVRDQGKPPVTESYFHVCRTEQDRIEAAVQWTESTDETFRSYVNGIRTSAGGTHESGFKSAIVRAVRNYMDTHDVKVRDVSITAEDIREGIVGILSVFCRNPMFQGQTKERFHNPEMAAAVDSVVRPALEAWLNSNTQAAERIVQRIVLAARAREASRTAASEVRRKTAAARRLHLPGKLADCTSTCVEESELFIVEGDSAGGSAMEGRDRRTQAVLPLRGKILNSEGMPTRKVLTNQELANLVAAIGTGAGEHFDISRLRYGKVILLMDADQDGHHITALLLTFFYRHVPELIRRGHVYLAQPPLYRIHVGKQTYWARDDAHKDEILRRLSPQARVEIQRFKGLGEMRPEVLAETTMHPQQRTLLRVQIDSDQAADQVFVRLLGKDASQRYEFIMNCSALAEELDV